VAPAPFSKHTSDIRPNLRVLTSHPSTRLLQLHAITPAAALAYSTPPRCGASGA
jgi:hypothetical protein